jgi:alanyl-tRNA synthetase
MTERLYYENSYLRDFTAQVLEASPDGLTVYLDRTAFYPTSGGQPFDTGSIAGRPVIDVIDEEERIAHRLGAPLASGDPAECSIDWSRRFDHMQQHSGQHLISAVFEERFGLKTVSFHLSAESSTIDLEGGAVDARVLQEAEMRANQVVWENRPVVVTFEQAAEAQGLRKPSERGGVLRIVSIQGLDRSACGGTHVRSTAEIGTVLLRKFEKIRQSTRVEFRCGIRAIRRARADYETLAKAAQMFSIAADEVPSAIAAQQEAARAADKGRRKLELDLAAYQGRELYAATEPGPDGLHRVTRRLASGNMEELRSIAQAFTAQPKALFVAAIASPPSILLAVSEDTGVDAGKALKAALAPDNGRGGGTPRIAQGSVSDASLLDAVLARLG